MKNSVVLSTYNGAKYILPLLDSLKNQSTKIDEVIISDDKSSDNTYEIIIDYIKFNNLKNWYISRNDVNLGWKKNFIKLLNMATGDYIYPCDQDDVWINDKIEKMSYLMDTNKDIYLLAANYIKFCDNDLPNGKFNENKLSTTKVEFVKSFYINYPGCVYCIRKELVNYINKYWYSEYPHDAFLWRTAAALRKLYITNFNSILYRRHGSTATGHESKDISTRIKTTIYYCKAIEIETTIIYDNKIQLDKKEKKYLHNLNKWVANRLTMLQKRSILKWMKNIKYVTYYYSWKSYIGDLKSILDAKLSQSSNWRNQ